MVYTGDGKGKTTAAMGLVMRAWTQGIPVGVYQFIKAAKWPTGERFAGQALATVHTEKKQGGPIEWHNFGAGRTSKRATREIDQSELARQGWSRVRQDLAAQAHGLYVLDEFCHVLARGWIDVDEVIEVLSNRPGTQHVVITGRNAPDKLIEFADLVSEVVNIKHPIDLGIKGQPGVEW
ncbi:MAG: cob(I)yrinic acid a,c-diamide adenosyltransferase [Brooklawnia sp.]